jgi:hypothetical protein
VEAAVEAVLSQEVGVALALAVVVVEDRAIPTLNLSAIISSVQHSVKDLEVLRLVKDVMFRLRGRLHKEILVPRR